MDPSIIVAVISAIAGITAAVIALRSATAAAREREDSRAEQVRRAAAEDDAYQRSAAFDERLQERMQAQIDRQAREIHVLQRQVAALMRQLRTHGIDPVLIPEET